MPQVTALKRAKARSGSARVAVELDGEPWVEAGEGIVAEFLLRRGLELSPETIAAIEARTVELDALSWCHQTIARRPLTERQLADSLRDRSYPPGVVELALARCRELRLVDDAAYAERFAASRSRRGHGPRRIQQDLRRRGIDAELVREAIDALADSDESIDPATACAELLQRRYRDADLDEPRVRAKAQRFLSGRGFAWSDIDAALRAHQSHLRG